MKKATLSFGVAIPLTLIALTLAALVMMNRAHAGQQIKRSDCFRAIGGGDMGRKMGIRNGKRLFDATWARLGKSCANLDRLGQIISETPYASGNGLMSACFSLGYTDTLWEQLEGAYDRCQVKCFSEGSFIGDISAQGYCAASIAVGGLYDPGFIAQPPLPFCGANLVYGCKSQYIQTATSEVNGCFPYTTGYFSQTFENSIRQDCFVPADVPIRDSVEFEDGTVLDLTIDTSLAVL